ncbi:MAG TPA: RNA methyltransferase [Candidatus Ventrimonas merdavium]|nr:RNA methyltransferase [Candidatus Ventrimonas merdavium]
MAGWIKIQDLNAPELDVYARLSEVQLLRYREPEPGLFIAESAKVIGRALDAGYEPVSLLVETRHIEGDAREIIARCGDIPIYTAEYETLKCLTGFPLTRGILCAMRRRRLPDAGDICAGARRIAVLEKAMNPTNLGAIFRAAAALQIDGVLLTPGSTNPLYRRASRVSMGTVFQIPWTFFNEDREPWPGAGMDMLKSLGFQTAAMALRDDSVSVEDPMLKKAEKLAIILGTEGEGLEPETIAACDHIVRIPMREEVDSLNVAAAAAVAFWELGKPDGTPKIV